MAGQSCMPGHFEPSQTHEEASASVTPSPGFHLSETGDTRLQIKSERQKETAKEVCGVPPRGWARPAAVLS